MIRYTSFADNHDIISMKLYEIDVPQTKKEQQDEKEVDRTVIKPFASGAEPYRGTCITFILIDSLYHFLLQLGDILL